MAKNQETKN